MGPSMAWEPFNGMLGGLLRWARREGTYNLDTAVEAGRSLSDLAEIISHLWGHQTPGGRLYPAPLARHPSTRDQALLRRLQK